MSNTDKTKTRPVVAFTAGTALGTASIIDTSGWDYMTLYSQHGGTGGSRTISVYVNAGTRAGTAATTFPDAVLIGSKNSDQAGAGTPVWNCGSLTDQALISYGTSTNSSFTVSYVMRD